MLYDTVGLCFMCFSSMILFLVLMKFNICINALAKFDRVYFQFEY